MTKEEKDLCKTCEHYWTDFPLQLDHYEPHCEIIDKKYFNGVEKFAELVPYPCSKCPFDCYTKKKSMTREEERKQAAYLYSPNNAHNTADTFEYAAEWADKTMIDKACEWLKENMFNYIIEDPFLPSGLSVTLEENKMVEDFHKAME